MIQLFQIFGIIAGFFTSIRFIPQVIKIIRIKKARDISLWFLIFVFLQSLFLILYGWFLPEKDYYIILMNIIPIFCVAIILFYKIKNKDE